MANTKSKRRQRGSIRPNGAGFQVRVYAGRDPLAKKDIYLHEQAETETEAEKARTRLLHQVDEKRHPKTQVTMSFLLDRWLCVAELDETSYERAEGIIRNCLKPTFGDLKAGKLTAEMLELFYARLRQCQEQCEGRRNGKTDPKTKQKHVCEPLAANSIRKIHFILRPALNRALRWGYVTTNVAALAEPPSQPKPNPDPPTPEEAALVLNGPGSEHCLAAGPGLGNVPVHDDGHRLTPRRDVRPALVGHQPRPPRTLREALQQRPQDQGHQNPPAP
ncbi:hypothetical protein ACWCQS_18360 [Streptomyces sp. NPDC002076]